MTWLNDKTLWHFTSKYICPYRNLAVEGALFDLHQRLSTEYLIFLFTWVDRLSIIIGRNQVPWFECDMGQVAMLQTNNALFNCTCDSSRATINQYIPWLVRRASGGGTVVHDEGNSCWSFIMPKSLFCRTRTAQSIVQALNVKSRSNSLLWVNERHDLCQGEAKISGAAYRLSKNSAYHHGTFLRGGDLVRLGQLLKPSLKGETAGIPSVRAKKVTNYQFGAPNSTMEHEEFVERLLQGMKEINPGLSIEYINQNPFEYIPSKKSINQNENLCAEMASWNSIYGNSPDFTTNVHGIKIEVKEGLITSIDNSKLSADIGKPFDQFFQRYYNKRGN